ncbi:hypothetical protein BDV95DRAFT_139098 [Massariosphaeria phaeospora]|uniref:Uncharacterized protein n=1 Tax=Massariosphaeria phaeospora TaxID=100035 RepID=A0A7C8MUA8_9PLEO|nr:hypothetical protein BDV95DRAFT_139098 [Massariosphaeria phaeospora]
MSRSAGGVNDHMARKPPLRELTNPSFSHTPSGRPRPDWPAHSTIQGTLYESFLVLARRHAAIGTSTPRCSARCYQASRTALPSDEIILLPHLLLLPFSSPYTVTVLA